MIFGTLDGVGEIYVVLLESPSVSYHNFSFRMPISRRWGWMLDVLRNGVARRSVYSSCSIDLEACWLPWLGRDSKAYDKIR